MNNQTENKKIYVTPTAYLKTMRGACFVVEVYEDNEWLGSASIVPSDYGKLQGISEMAKNQLLLEHGYKLFDKSQSSCAYENMGEHLRDKADQIRMNTHR